MTRKSPRNDPEEDTPEANKPGKQRPEQVPVHPERMETSAEKWRTPVSVATRKGRAAPTPLGNNNTNK